MREGGGAGAIHTRAGAGTPLRRRQPKVCQDLAHDRRVLDRRDEPQAAAAARAGQHVDLEGPALTPTWILDNAGVRIERPANRLLPRL